MSSMTQTLPARGTEGFESSTMSKRDYYTLRDKGLSVQDAVTPQTQNSNAPVVVEKKAGGKPKNFEVIMLDGSSQQFQVDPNLASQELFERVCEYLQLHETEYFGLCYRDSAGMFFWLTNDKKLGKQLQKVGTNKLELMVKFYPPDPENLHENLTRYYMALQVRQNLMASLLPCTFTTYVVLGGYVVQSEIGDFDPLDPSMNNLTYLQDCPFCPEDQRQLELMESVSELHRCLRGLTPEEADLRFLNNAKKLAMYGVDLHEAKDAQNDEVFVGVYHGGVVVYRNSLRISRFSWPKILKVSYKRNLLKLAVRTSEDKMASETIIEFKCSSPKLVKRLWRAVVDHHGFFRLKASEKPSKPLIPGTFTPKANYTGPTRKGAQQHLSENPSAGPTQDIRKSFKKKAAPATKARMEEGLEDGYNREHRMLEQQPHALAGAGDEFSGADRQRQMQRPDMMAPVAWQMCAADADSPLSYSLAVGDGLSVACPADSVWRGCRANQGVEGAGQWYFESEVAGDSPVAARIGWSGADGDLNVGRDGLGVGFGADPDGRQGRLTAAGDSKELGDAPQLNGGDVVGALVDLDAGTVAFTLNGKPVGEAQPLPQQMQRLPTYPTTCGRDGAQLQWNFGDDPSRPLKYPPAAPFRPVCEAAGAGAAATNPRDWRLNPHDTTGQQLLLDADQRRAQAVSGSGWQGARADRGLRGAAGGKFFFEVEPLEPDGLARVGWATEDASLELGRDAGGWGYGADYDGFGLAGNQGKRLHADLIDTYGEPFANGDVVGCAIDLDAGVLQFSRNGRQFGPAYQLPPEALASDVFFPAVCMQDQTLDVNLGQRPFKFPPGEDWKPVSEAGDEAVKKAARGANMQSAPSVDQKYDMFRQNRPQIRPPSQPTVREHDGHPTVSVHETRTETEELGEPEEEIVTYTDEHGNKITKKVVRQKQKRQVVTSKVVESRGVRLPDNDGSSVDHLERQINGGRSEIRPTRRNLVLSDDGEGDDELNDIIFQQTGFSREERLVDENVNDFSMSTIDSRKPQVHESDI